MNSKRIIQAAVLIVILAFVCISAHAHGDNRPMKKGILLVAFGSSIPEAQVSFKNIDNKVKAAYPGIPVRWAFTSSIIRHKLAKQGKNLDSIAIALSKMMEENFTHVAVQSLHTIPGEEYNDLIATISAFKHIPGGFDRIIVGQPLISKQEDMEKVADAIIQNIPKERKKKDGVVLMGHGTPHPANAFYAAMAYNLQQSDSNIIVGTVEGSPTIDDVKKMLLAKKIKKAYLIPFMSVAGDHARNDMAGDEDDSWKSILTKAGIKCVPVLKGSAEFDNIVDIWVDHLELPLEHFNH
ncbi:sirohydrochlorin cobaltochelatase [Desulfosarcina sp. BuS5]|uniref:sirohydrochlorin cobaltochelatase n=1 Tax=Desulfosarcina sp. BuS5 TaxID=933262 RepID=UPI0004800E70|nr:sirohydrochlorin cobaltochelatase [Desulfosarcina sp. BuS5]WDN87307.1 sirohydrochlorin cobaltochelatase [Desulfosarcina sp. BuS5]